jgi:hypothetical protein
LWDHFFEIGGLFFFFNLVYIILYGWINKLVISQTTFDKMKENHCQNRVLATALSLATWALRHKFLVGENKESQIVGLCATILNKLLDLHRKVHPS